MHDSVAVATVCQIFLRTETSVQIFNVACCVLRDDNNDIPLFVRKCKNPFSLHLNVTTDLIFTDSVLVYSSKFRCMYVFVRQVARSAIKYVCVVHAKRRTALSTRRSYN